ncbi:MAG: DNA-3-methyladenine glycosylase I [Chromatiales bacterium]|nr:DNA-3-methyladenine glycosylase I [Chromatiales bacterium]
MPRCDWVTAGDELYARYHDQEWGVPSRDARHLFEMLILEGAQAGLSWRTVLHRREGYRAAFAGFDPERISRFDARKRERLREDARIIRNRLKIDATVANAKAWLRLAASDDPVDFMWSFVDGKPVQNRWPALAEVPAETAQSRSMSKALKQLGFRFVGPTICYAFMQATGMVNDHLTTCTRHAELAR